PGRVAQPEVEEHHVPRGARRGAHGVAAARDPVAVVALVAQGYEDALAGPRIVVDDEDALSSVLRAAGTGVAVARRHRASVRVASDDAHAHRVPPSLRVGVGCFEERSTMQT